MLFDVNEVNCKFVLAEAKEIKDKTENIFCLNVKEKGEITSFYSRNATGAEALFIVALWR